MREGGCGVSAARAMLFLAMAALAAGCGASTYPVPPGSWTLEVCGGVSSWGCGTFRTFVYPGKSDCYEALATLHSGDQPIAESELKRNTIAACRPSRPGDNGSRY